MAKTPLGKLKAAAIGMLELPRLDARILAGFRELADLTGTTSDALDECDIARVVPASLLRPSDPRARIVGQAITVLNRVVSERRTLAIEKQGLFGAAYREIGSGSITEIEKTRAVDLGRKLCLVLVDLLERRLIGRHVIALDLVRDRIGENCKL